VHDAVPALGSLAAEGQHVVAVSTTDAPIAVAGAFVTGNYFEVLGTSAHAGRLLAREDEQPEAPPVAVVSEHFWRTRLEGKPEAIGQPVLLAGRSFTIVGVTPPRFHGLGEGPEIGEDDSHGLQIWIPLQHASSWPGVQPRNEAWLGTVVGRIQRGHTLDQARAHLAVPAAQLAAEYPLTRANASLLLSTTGLSPHETPLEILMIISAMLSLPLTVFAISCANVTNLQLARAAERARELAVRLSFGAARVQLIRLLTFETLFPAATAVGTSIVLTFVILRWSESFLPIHASMDWAVTAFSFALMMAVTFFTGLVPAWLVLRRPAALELKQTAQSGGLSLSRLRSVLVIGQVTLSLLMLCGAGLVLRSVSSMKLEVPAVLRSQIVVVFNPAQIGASERETSQFAAELLARAKADPRVVGASVSRSGGMRYRIPDTPNGLSRSTAVTEITPSWLQVMDLPILTGRPLTSADDQTVGLVSARLADSITPGESPLGHILQVDEESGRQRQVEIVGVVADNRTRPMLEGDRPAPVVYVTLPRNFSGPFTLRIRTQSADSVAAVAADLRRMVRAVDPRLPWLTLNRGEDTYVRDAPALRYVALSIGGLGMLGLALAATGLYAIMSYVVLLRRREIGVRMAIGADPRRIVTMIVWQALRLVLTGGIIGLALAVPLAFGLRAVFIGPISPMDPAAFLPPFALLLIVGLLASLLPARRASATDPINTLREE
jgi:predicted permease